MTLAGQRSAWLDLYKTILVVGMVTVHVLQLLSRAMPGWTERVSEFVNLVTFSGFLFAMGIGLGLSRGRERTLRERLWPVLMLLLAGYVSSFAFAMLVDRVPLTTAFVLDVVTMRRLFGWSEFLATFFVLYLLVALARPVLVGIATRPVLLIAACAACFGTSWLVMDQGWPLTATLVGTTKFASFPLLPYLPWFLVGIDVGRRLGADPLIRPSGTFSREGRREWNGGFYGLSLHWGLAALASGWLVWSLWATGQLPGRFPPTTLWIVGPALVLMIYLALARGIDKAVSLPRWVTLPGRHVLSFLLVSNLVIFTSRNLMGFPVREVWRWLGVSAVILVVIGLGWLALESAQARKKNGFLPARE